MKEVQSLMPHYIMQGIFFLAGAICFVAALTNAKWFLDSNHIGFLRRYLSRKLIRILYILIGIALMCLALYFYANLKQIHYTL